MEWVYAHGFEVLVVFLLYLIQARLQGLAGHSAWDSILLSKDRTISIYDINKVRKHLGLEPKDYGLTDTER